MIWAIRLSTSVWSTWAPASSRTPAAEAKVSAVREILIRSSSWLYGLLLGDFFNYLFYVLQLESAVYGSALKSRLPPRQDG